MSKLEYDMMKDYEKFDKTTSKVAKSGANFLELLTLVFIILKLCKVITWSWLWVLSPIWISWGIAIVIVIIMVIVGKK